MYLIVNKILQIVIAGYGTKSKPQAWGKWKVLGGF